ncbi:MAG TPA: hypothetical protein DHU69_01820 [Deltaproteobacteria bacterium]|nr:hypothetical protein [Deltaproteobacteria bacterium]HCY18506.1 hypothetical protein [Deltaproteobacteria bacterium]
MLLSGTIIYSPPI